MIATVFFSTQSVGANSCPKEHVQMHSDERNVKTGDYWITNVPKHSRLWEADVKETYSRLSKQRPPDFSCTFQDRRSEYYYGFTKGSCKNKAGIIWDPLSKSEPAYAIDSSGSHSLTSSCDGCGAVIVDNEGKKFWADRGIARPPSRLTGRSDLRNYYYTPPYHTIRDKNEHMLVEVIVLRDLFKAGNQQYIAIGREIETGFYCSYQGGISPSF
jgi:hypothetical protein